MYGEKSRNRRDDLVFTAVFGASPAELERMRSAFGDADYVLPTRFDQQEAAAAMEETASLSTAIRAGHAVMLGSAVSRPM